VNNGERHDGQQQPGGQRQRDAEQWRDEHTLPLDELTQAMATYSSDGQVDDVTGGDASAEQRYGHGAYVPGAAVEGGDADPDSEPGRAARPSPEGRTGPV
jgi:hypothetical protein